uniref:Uncharacterized protein n=1 Tax=Anguilla anguilla TaxID=7936 RepID=A0A0E9RVP2_ANGAN
MRLFPLLGTVLLSRVFRHTCSWLWLYALLCVALDKSVCQAPVM